MRIAVCDDDRLELKRIAALLDEYGDARRESVLHTEFQSAAELLASVGRVEYDLLLLDVLMPGLNGIEAAREIRDRSEEVKIVFLSSTPEYAVESYQVQATSYLLKPASAERVFPILDKLMDELRRPEASLRVKTRSRVFLLPYRRIEYIEVMAKTLYFHMTDGGYEEVAGSLKEYEAELLEQPGFMKVHRSYIVALQWTREIRKWELTTVSGKRVPVSRSVYPQLRKAYMDWLFAEGGVE